MPVIAGAGDIALQLRAIGRKSEADLARKLADRLGGGVLADAEPPIRIATRAVTPAGSAPSGRA